MANTINNVESDIAFTKIEGVNQTLIIALRIVLLGDILGILLTSLKVKKWTFK